MARHPPPEFTAAFVESLPRAYQNKYEPEVIVAHAAVSAFRGKAPAAAGLFGRAGNGICVSATDRPGLLAVLSASLVLCRLDVSHAEVYTRATATGANEAIDLFWVRSLDAPPGSKLQKADAERLEAKVIKLLEGNNDARGAVERQLAERAAEKPHTAADATVRFVADESGGLATLEVETTDRSGLLFSLASALYGQNVQIVESEVRTSEDRVFDRFRIVEFDGSAITGAHRLEIQIAVLGAIEPARRTQAPPA